MRARVRAGMGLRHTCPWLGVAPLHSGDGLGSGMLSHDQLVGWPASLPLDGGLIHLINSSNVRTR